MTPVLAQDQIAPAAPAKVFPDRRRPAQIYFGVYRNMDQLVAPDAKWDFVWPVADAPRLRSDTLLGRQDAAQGERIVDRIAGVDPQIAHIKLSFPTGKATKSQ